MTDPDPIASATLARLYLTQGHGSRARAILQEVLGRTPFDGDALALSARLASPRPRLSATTAGDELSLRWQGVSDPGRYFLVISMWGGDDPIPGQWVTSRPCTSAFGRHRLARPWARGVLVATLGRVEQNGFVPQVVSEPLGWG